MSYDSVSIHDIQFSCQSISINSRLYNVKFSIDIYLMNFRLLTFHSCKLEDSCEEQQTGHGSQEHLGELLFGMDSDKNSAPLVIDHWSAAVGRKRSS